MKPGVMCQRRRVEKGCLLMAECLVWAQGLLLGVIEQKVGAGVVTSRVAVQVGAAKDEMGAGLVVHRLLGTSCGSNGSVDETEQRVGRG